MEAVKPRKTTLSESSTYSTQSIRVNQNVFGSGIIFPEPAVDITGSLRSLPPAAAEGGATPRRALDGGWGWVIVVMSFFILSALGLSFGSFGILYVDLVTQFGGQAGPIGWVGSIFVFVGNISTITTSIMVDMYGSRIVAFVAGICLSLGFFLSSFATNDVMIIITYGFIAGLGFGSGFLACIVIVQQYFDCHRALAAGLSSAGLSAGTLVSGPLIQFLIDTYGWRGTMMIEAGIFLHITVLSLFFRPISQYCKPVASSNTTSINTQQKTSGSKLLQEIKDKLRDVAIMKDTRFLIMCASGLLVPMPLIAFMIHTPSRAVFCGVERSIASMLPTIIGTAALVSRISFGLVANLKCANRILMNGIGGLSVSILVMVYTYAVTLPWIAVVCVAFGCAMGCYTSVQSTAIVDLVGIARFPRAQALFMIFFGTGSLVSTPLVGYILDITQDYSPGLIVTAACGLLGACVVISIPIYDICNRKDNIRSGS